VGARVPRVKAAVRYDPCVPELPEVEAARSKLSSALRGRRFTSVEAAPDPVVMGTLRVRRLREALVGAHVVGVGRHGKHLWIETDRRPWLALHFGMTGDVQVLDEDDAGPRHARLTLHLDDGRRLVFSDARRFGRIRLQQDPRGEPPISGLGPDPLAEAPTVETLRKGLRRRNGPIKASLLDQSLFAGVGNWVADEVLYQAGIAPQRAASSLTDAELARLRRALLHVLRVAVAANADDLRFPRGWLFHHRWGRRADATTSRGERIRHDTIGGRTTAWVPGRQR
jgi:formamidopyrimidine-DNA glycosylase